MFHLDLLAQIYFISFVVGSFFIVFNVLIGQIGHSASHDGLSSHHGLGNHGLPGHHGVSGQHSISGHDTSSQHSGSSQHSISTHSDSNNSNPQAWLENYTSTNLIEKLKRRLLIHIQSEDIPSSIGFFLIAWLSPMRIAIWLTSFGVSGFFIERLLPWLSIFTLIPAIIIAALFTKIFNSFIAWTVGTLDSPNVFSQENMIGSVAEVITPMSNNLVGEIIYKIDSGRTNCAAKTAKEGLEIKRGTKVMIIGMQNHIALVEPVTDPLLLENSL